MKKVFIIVIFTVLLIGLIGFAFAKGKITGNEVLSPELYASTVSDNSSPGEGSTCVCPSGYIADGNVCNPKCYYSQPRCLAPSIVCNGNNVNANTGTVVGASCGTVTPGYQTKCCISRGYSGWDPENFTCIEGNVQRNEKNETTEGMLGAYAGVVRNRGNESGLNRTGENETFACPMDAKMCQDGTYVSRIGPHCEFTPCPIQYNINQYNISNEEICCKIYGTGMNETNIHYEITSKKECAIPENFVGGNREIVNNSYCIEQIQKDRQEFIDNQWEIMQDKNRIKNNYTNQSGCPDNCSCAGSTVKCDFGNGTRIMTIYAGKSGNVIVQIENINASTNVTLYKADGKVYGIFRDNNTHEIILPDEIRNITKEGKSINWSEENITLNETGFYHVEAKKNARLFWIFPVKEKVQFDINSETGEITKTQTKWWAFLAKDVTDKTNSAQTQ
jgi:hypothetical protein